MSRFANRTEAGELLASKLVAYANRPNVLVLALPRGGVPVAYAVAKTLHAPLDIFLVRKLSVPGHEELAMGAIAGGGVRVLNDEVIQYLHIAREVIDAVATRELQETARREETTSNRPTTRTTAGAYHRRDLSAGNGAGKPLFLGAVT